MPIKLPKGFQRRKSSGNALEEVLNPPEPSFKVYERPKSRGKSFDGGVIMKNAAGTPPPPAPPPKDGFDRDEELFTVVRPGPPKRSSGGTSNSITNSNDGSVASSTRRSTSSTNPSSTDARSDKNVQVPGQRPLNDIPVPPVMATRSNFLRNAGRTFSFGMRNPKDSMSVPTAVSTPPSSYNHLATGPRDRTVSASTTSTATPPRLFEKNLDFDDSELDSFSNMFESIGKRASKDMSPIRLVSEPQEMLPSPPNSYSRMQTHRSEMPARASYARNGNFGSSPYSCTSQDSHDGLMRSPSPSKTVTQASPPSSSYISDHTTLPRTQSSNGSVMSSPGKKSTALSNRTSSITQTPKQMPSMPVSISAQSLSTISDEPIDPTLLANAQLAARFEQIKPSTPPKHTDKKIMTPAQFERYKQQQEMDRNLRGGAADSDSDDGDNKYDDDDEVEKEKEVLRRRKKQEAHLAVYRQQMMKVTGNQAGGRSTSTPATSSRVGTPDINNRLSHMTLDSKQSEKSSGEDEEEDEDVPLGILAAHGFPNKNRPPVKLSLSNSHPNLRAVSQQMATPPIAPSVAPSIAPSVSGEPNRRSGLPPFARNLPQDPYFGAGLVNASDRQPLALHAPSLVTPPPSGPAPGMFPIHPAGLVGVIAGEERARAMRRGSPNMQGGYDTAPMLPQQPGMSRYPTMNSIPSMGHVDPMMGGMQSGLTPGDQAQLQMSAQMTQMMQMQMQWMQQMQQMMGGQMPQAPPSGLPPQQFGQNNFLGPPQQVSRPQSMLLSSTNGPTTRTMSTLTPSMANWQLGGQPTPSVVVNGTSIYAPSIAPSERSTVGLASRYRPVSVATDMEPPNRRTSTLTATTSRPWSVMNNGSTLSGNSPRPPNKPTARTVQPAIDDDEDDEGWAELKSKKDKKQKSWMMKKTPNSLQDLYANLPSADR